MPTVLKLTVGSDFVGSAPGGTACVGAAVAAGDVELAGDVGLSGDVEPGACAMKPRMRPPDRPPRASAAVAVRTIPRLATATTEGHMRPACIRGTMRDNSLRIAAARARQRTAR